jgi:hypothetical protein
MGDLIALTMTYLNHSGDSPKSVHVQPGMGVHDGPEYARRAYRFNCTSYSNVSDL